MPDPLDAALAVLNQEFNSGENFSESPVEPAEAPETDTPALTIDATGRAHAPDGKFATKEEEAEEETTEFAETSDEDEAPAEGNEADTDVSEDEDELVFEVDDPEVAALLDKYQGDPVKALKAAAEAQSLIGRQGAELSELRSIREQLSNLQSRMTPYRSSIDEDPASLVQEVLERAIQTGQFDDGVYDAAIQAWGEEDPVAATRLDTRVQLARAEAERIVAQGDSQTTTLDSELAALKQRHPDVEKFLPSIAKIVEDRPLWREAISQGDPRTRAQAFEDLYLLARSQSDSSDTSAAARKIVLRAKADAERAKEDASVVTASKTSVVEVGPGPNENLQNVLRELSGLEDLVIE